MELTKKKETSIGGDAVRLTASKIITLGIAMVVTMLLSRFRSLEEYGTYSQILLITNLATSIFMLGLPNCINFFLARADTQEEKQTFLSIYYTLSTVLGIIMALVLLCAVPLFEFYFNNPLIRTFSYFIAVYPWTKVISSSIENVLVVYKRTKFLIVYRVIHSVLSFLAVVIVSFLKLTFSVYLIIFLLTEVFLAVTVYFIAAYLCGGIRIEFDKKWVKRIFAFSVPIGLSSVIGTLDIEVDKLLIGFVMKTEDLAIYTNAAKELPVTIIASSITAILLPQISRMLKKNENEKAVQLWNHATELSLILIAYLAFAVFAFPNEVISVLYSSKYLSGVSVFRVYNLVLLLRCTYFGMILNASGNTKYVLYSSVIALAVNIVLNPLFYYFLGMVGPAIATFVSLFIIIVFQLKKTERCLGIHITKLFPMKRAGIILVINIFLTIIFIIIKMVIHLEVHIGEMFESLLLAMVWGAIYLIFFLKRMKSLWKDINEAGK